MQVGIARLPALEGLAEGLVVVGDAAVDGAAGGGPPAQDAQQRRLAAAGRAHQRQHLAGGRRPGYPSQYLPRRSLPRHPVLHLRKLPRTPPLRYEAFRLRDVCMHGGVCFRSFFTLRYIGRVGSVTSFLRRVPASMSTAAAAQGVYICTHMQPSLELAS